MKIYRIAETIKLNEIIDYDQQECLFDVIKDSDLMVDLPVEILLVEQMKSLIPWLSQENIMDVYESSSTVSQKQLVNRYMRQDLSNEIVVVYGNNIMDGNHRVVAAIKSNQNMKKVDIYDLPE